MSSIFDGVCLCWGMLGFRRGWVLVFGKRLLNIPRDAGVQCPVLVVPFEADSNIFAARSIDCDVVPTFQRLFEMGCMFISLEFDSKVIHY